MIYDRNMFDIQIVEGASAGNASAERALTAKSAGSHKYSYFTATTELNNNTLH